MERAGARVNRGEGGRAGEGGEEHGYDEKDWGGDAEHVLSVFGTVERLEGSREGLEG